MKNEHGAILIDIENVAHFCQLDPETAAIDSCKTLHLKTDWVVDSVYLRNRMAVVIILTETETEKQGNVIYFNYYFHRDIMTWYDRPEFVPGKKFLVDISNHDEYLLFEFHPSGIVVFDLEFRSYFVIEGHKIKDARTIEIYLEGHVINRTKVYPLVYGEIIDFFADQAVRVVRDPVTKGVYTNLGFVGANLNYEYNSEKVIYYFNFHLPMFTMTKDLDLWYDKNPDAVLAQAPDLGEFLDFLVDGEMNLYINTGSEIVTGELYHDYINFRCEELNSKGYEIPDNFKFANEDFVSRMEIGSEIIMLIQNPYRIFSFNRLMHVFFDYELTESFNSLGLSHCKMKVALTAVLGALLRAHGRRRLQAALLRAHRDPPRAAAGPAQPRRGGAAAAVPRVPVRGQAVVRGGHRELRQLQLGPVQVRLHLQPALRRNHGHARRRDPNGLPHAQ